MKTITIEPVHQAILTEGLKAFLELTQKAIKITSGQQKSNLEIQIKMIKETDKIISEYNVIEKLYTRDEVFELLKELRRECIENYNKGLSPENIGIAQYIK